MKKLVTLLLAMVMIFSLATTAAAASITITPPTVPEGAEETGITYTAYKIFDATITYKEVDGEQVIDSVAYTIEKSSPYYDTIAAATTYFKLTATAGNADLFVVEALDAYTADVANTFADTLKAVTATAAGTLTKQADGNYKLEGLENGYYLVTSSVGSDLILDTIGDITVKTKNEYPGLDKKVEGKDDYTTADKGEVIPFTITVTIPANATGEIVVHDNMDGLEYVDWTPVENVTVSTTNDDDCEVHFVLSAACVEANKGKTVTISYTAKVIADVANNQAWLVDDTYTTKPDETKVYSTDIVINKYDGSNEEIKLADAKFVLKNSDGKFYKVDNDGNVTWVDAQADATVMTTDAEGKAEFTDIADGTYYLVETKAPTGYNLLTAPVEVKVEAKLDNEGAVIDVTTDVENNAGTELPSTGGVGTTMFYVIGGLMMLMAVVLLVTKKRMASAE